MGRRLPFCCALVFISAVAFAADEPPHALDDRLKIELFAEHPQLVTPTGIDVDHLGRVVVIESNTHFPPDGYAGHSTDRILILENTDDDPQADKITVFADGLVHTMSIAVQPLWLSPSVGREPSETGVIKPTDAQPGASRLPLRIFVATRSEILLLVDTDGDLKADEKTRLVHLETKGNYPHNGLAGFAFDALGNMFFGFGENLGADYKILGSDGTTLTGGGEGGNLYRCRPDGTKLERWATGFWNPHASCFDAFGRLFTVDNDPDSRPPCRLLHIIPGGDYGYRFRNGRKGTHPFTSWNGEIPGTLPMVAGTGEAPSGIVCYENDGFPDDYLGTLLVGSWGDHRIDQFVLEPKGASFTSNAKTIIQGGENFRPVGLAVAPDGSLYFSDWVLKDYKLHGKGRVWRVSGKEVPRRTLIDAAKITDLTKPEDLQRLLFSRRLDVRQVAARLLFAERNSDVQNFLRGIPRIVTDPLADRAIALGDQFRDTDQHHDSEGALLWSGNIPVKNLDPEDIDEFLTPFEIAGFRKELCDLKLGRDELQSGFRKNDPNPKINLFFQLMQVLCGKDLYPKDSSLCRGWLDAESIALRRLAVQWIGEENLSDLRPDVESLLADPHTTPDLFLACLATLQLLDGKPASEFEKNPPTQYIAAMVTEANRPAALRATALRMLPANATELTAPLMKELLSSPDESLRQEAVRTLAVSSLPEARELLLPIAANPQASLELRAEAIAGLCNGPHEQPLPKEVEALLLKYARGDAEVDLSDASSRRRAVETLQLEALRSLRGRAVAGSEIRKTIENLDRKTGIKQAVEIVLNGKRSAVEAAPAPDSTPADASAGRRTFFHHNGPQCGKCHTVQGRGGQVGPDLTIIARTMDREKLLSSILEPSKEISPQFTTWIIETTEGKTHTGFILEDNRTGQIKLGTAAGDVLVINEDEVETREPSKVSVMPEKLHEQMTTHELRDLLTFLETLK